jgi:hypothetical protein
VTAAVAFAVRGPLSWGMDATRIRCQLVLADGVARRVGPAGLTIGRQPDCELVTDDPVASRRHALVRLTLAGAEVVPLGKGPVTINGVATTATTALADGDRLAVPGLAVDVRVAVVRPEPGARTGFQLVHARGASFGLSHSPFVVGGAATDDLVVRRWPASAVRLHLVDGELYVEAAVDGVTVDGVAQGLGDLAPIGPGQALALAGEVFTVACPPSPAVTAEAAARTLPTRVTIETLPRGGRVVFLLPDGERAVFLADRRLDLLVALARPGGGHVAGEFIPDDLVRAVVWPRNLGVSRQEINMLISRCRRDLVLAGLPGARLLERAPGGGGTRLALAPGATVTMT